MRQPMHWFSVLLVAVPGALAVRPAYAHGFGERYDLPIPLEYYLAGAGATVALSFVVIALFVRGASNLGKYGRLNLLHNHWLAALLQARLFTFAIKLASASLFLLVIFTSIWGEQDPNVNFSPTFVWVIWWIGMGFFVALVGNLWTLVNPWSIIFGWAEGVYRRLKPEGEKDLGFEYPRLLGVWPAFVLFLGFAWLENAYPQASQPKMIAVMVLTYSAITWGGMLLFGKHVWLRYGEGFSVIFGFLARFAPIEARVSHGGYCLECATNCVEHGDGCINCYLCWEQAGSGERELNLRPYAAGLVRQEDITTDMLAFVILMLATVTFDGFKSTPIWGDIQDTLFSTMAPFFGTNAIAATDTLGLLLFPIIFLGAYFFFSWMMSYTSRCGLPTSYIARAFVYSLIPIALAYNIAHFFTLLAIMGQLIIPLASDPFGYGWDLLGTADYKVNIGLVNARFAWLLGVGVIVLGHIIAVYLAHLIALRTIEDQRAALKSQYPMLAFMVTYTAISLWIIAQPIVERT